MTESLNHERLRQEMTKHAEGAGIVIHAEMYELAKGGGWVVVFDTEYAALKVHYKYRQSPGIHFGWSETFGGFYVSCKSRGCPGSRVGGRAF